MKDRILKIIREEQLTSARFADILGVQRSSISHYLSGRNNPGIDFIQKILLKFKYVSADWLISGKGEMYKHSLLGQSSTLEQITGQESTIETSPLELKIPFTELPKPEILEIKEDIKHENNTKVIENKILVNKIIIYYSDHTFTEFFPNG